MTKPVRTLVVDDDEGVLFVLSETLGRSGHAVTGISSGQEALDRLRDTCPGRKMSSVQRSASTSFG